jgi:hypothetical protein
MSGIQSGTLYALESRTTAQTGDTITNTVGARALHVMIHWTVEPLTSTLTFTIQGRTSPEAPWYTVLVSAALTAVGDVLLRVDPELTAAANTIAKDAVPPQFRVNVGVGDADAATYAVYYALLG